MLAFLTVSLSASSRSLHLGVSGLAPGCPPTQSRGCSPHPAALGHLGPLNLQPSQAEGHPIPPPAPSLPAWAPRFPCAPLRIGPHPGCPAPRRRQGQSLESGPPLRGDRGGAGARGPRRPARTHHATLPGPAHHRGAAQHSPAAGASPAGSRSGDAASSGPGRVPAGAQHGAAQRRPPAPARAERTDGCPLLAAGGIDARRPDARARRQPRAKLEPGAAQTLTVRDGLRGPRGRGREAMPGDFVRSSRWRLRGMSERC